jgi:tRNA 2-selenouridine synthase
LHSQGEQVIDLEGMANHRGSAFGTIGEQPSTEHFENVLAEELLTMNPNRLIWLEDESKSIGRVHLPDELKAKMNDAPMVVIEKDFNQRVKHLCTQYGVESVNDLIAGFERISRKMGGQHAKAAIGALKEKDLERACGLALKYYDRTYAHALKRSGRKPLASIDITGASHAEAADKLIQWKNQNLPN